jgi:hypothetical protein
MRAIVVSLLTGALCLAVARAGDDAKKIPLDSIHATTGQKDVKRLSTAMDGAGKYIDPAGAALAKLYGGLKQGGVGLVAGKDIAAAVEASGPLFARGAMQGELTVDAGAPLWAAVFFGTNGSSPPAWQVKQVEVKGRSVRIGYAKQPAFTDDIHHYLAWIPLGKATAGEWTLELYDVGGKEAAVKRQVTVKVR